MNIVFIMTDTQRWDMVGAYGQSWVNTPNLDRLCAEGIRFDRAYTTCPLCTPARGGIFTGMHPQVNGAFCNNVAPFKQVPFMGEVFRHHGYRAGYTGKWHLDGSAYFGDGQPDGGFEPDWWYDGKRYAQEIGDELFHQYRTVKNADELRHSGLTEATMWGKRVADNAIDFLHRVGNENFILAVSFDEPHGPFIAPPEYWDAFNPDDLPKPANFFAPLDDKPNVQKAWRGQKDVPDWSKCAESKHRFYGCNTWIDNQIGRVIDAVDQHHADDTVIIYTSDHGDMQFSHGIGGKGPVMYDEIAHIPFIIRTPGSGAQRGVVCDNVVSQIDIMPTMLDLAGLNVPKAMHGVSLVPTLNDPAVKVRDTALINFNRFAINHDDFGEFYPIRCLTDGRYKLSINLFETDELYDMVEDPGEMTNRINDASLTEVRDALHDQLLDEMDRIRDPFRSFRWGDRPWRSVRSQFFYGGARREKPRGFFFEPTSVGATGSRQ